ncbi:UNVERIFIED_CONTAM: Sorting nexin-6 [Gekko kuhli]
MNTVAVEKNNSFAYVSSFSPHVYVVRTNSLPVSSGQELLRCWYIVQFWLHDSFVENENYTGYIIPSVPPRPDFDVSREKLQKLGEGSMTKEEFTERKQELETEYLAIFKKTVAMHEVFLCRVAAHPILRKVLHFHVFLEYNQDLSVHGKNKKEKLGDFFKNMAKFADGVIVSGVKDVDDFFEHERTFL